MVNTKNISAYEGEPPQEDTGERHIEKGPLYDLSDLALAIEKGNDNVVFWTKKCTKDVQNLGFEHEDIRDLLRVISKGDATYKNSQWCMGTNNLIAACDAYVVIRQEWIENAGKDMRCEYYVKFALNKSGKVVLLVSCHLSN